MKKTLVLCLAIAVLFGTIFSASAKVVTTYGDWTLEKYNSEKEWKVDSCALTDRKIDIITSYAGLPVTYVSEYAFANNAALEELNAFAELVGFGEYAFINNTALQKVTVPYTVSVIGKGAFLGTSSLREINLEDTRISAVEQSVFKSSGITSISFPDSCNLISSEAFANCASLEKAVIPTSVTSISESAFDGCDNLVIYCYTDSYAHEYAEANGIEYVLIDASVEVTFKLGDADGDGLITVMDATAIQRILVDLDADVDGMKRLRGAVVENEALNITHATKIQRYLADYDVEEPIDEEVTRTIIPEN